MKNCIIVCKVISAISLHQHDLVCRSNWNQLPYLNIWFHIVYLCGGIISCILSSSSRAFRKHAEKLYAGAVPLLTSSRDTNLSNAIKTHYNRSWRASPSPTYGSYLLLFHMYVPWTWWEPTKRHIDVPGCQFISSGPPTNIRRKSHSPAFLWPSADMMTDMSRRAQPQLAGNSP